MNKFSKPFFLIIPLLLCCGLLCSCGEKRIEELTVVVTEEDIGILEKYSGLKSLDLSGSTCYESINRYISAHPDVNVKYVVDIDGSSVSNKDENISFYSSDPGSLTAYAPYLQNLSVIDLGCTDMSNEQISEIQQAFPSALIKYTVNILGTEYPMDTKELSLVGFKHSDVSSVSEQLSKFSALEKINLPGSDGTALVGIDDFVLLASSCPAADINCSFELFGQELSTADERIIYKVVEIGNDGVKQFREVLPYMKNLTYLRLDRCGIDNETMAQLRDDFPEIKVVWRIDFGMFSVLTDVEKIWAYCDMRDEYSSLLYYCTDVKYIDIGHSPVSDISFFYYMPKMEVAIVALTNVTDLTPLGSCPNLEYLEFSTTQVTDASALANCTNLEHINMGHTQVTDLSPFFNLKKLKRFYCQNNWMHLSEDQMQEFIDLHPDCETKFDWSGEGGPLQNDWRYGAPLIDGWQERYYLIRQQFGYDNSAGLSTLYNDPEK